MKYLSLAVGFFYFFVDWVLEFIRRGNVGRIILLPALLQLYLIDSEG
jgi:hypothetical protein